ncbi:hypothetical protein PENCOP_c004G02436 [Penicillium coprophilum]|uniref:Uncharacterized protein n=1 Tax=Penicillium coprophilum TaxID=36646 RepID=A0A1V6UTX8_9EURO|nr:hypothetical protein PENCOP_c004G02436 [Penicillium coprophilum]
MNLYHHFRGASSRKIATYQASETRPTRNIQGGHNAQGATISRRHKEDEGNKSFRISQKIITRVPTIWFKFCCDIAPLGGALGPGVGVEWTGVPGNGCWEGIIPFPFTPGPMLPLRGPGLGAPPGADIIDDTDDKF